LTIEQQAAIMARLSNFSRDWRFSDPETMVEVWAPIRPERGHFPEAIVQRSSATFTSLPRISNTSTK
jgi:hypothetical protein